MIRIKDTENVGVLEVDLGVSNGVGRVEQYLAFPIEFNGLSRFVDSVSGLNQGEVSDSFSLDSDVLLVHVFYVVDVENWPEVCQFKAL